MIASLRLATGRRSSRAVVVWLAVLVVAAARSVTAQPVANGTLLVASPELTDPSFARSVVLVLRHETEGTLGVMLNRPTNLEPGVVFPELAPSVGGYPGRLFRGGPVSPTQVLILVRGLAAATVAGPEVLDKVFLSIDAESLPEMTRLADGTNDLRLYAGHVAWAPGQLDAEIRSGSWQLLPGTAELVFHDKPGELWSELEGRASRAGPNVVAGNRSRTASDGRETRSGGG
jgi:putative transcriptional regulator